MGSVLGFLRKLSMFIRRNRFDSELADEMSFHLAQAEKQFQAEGMASGEARSAAIRQFGNATRLKEESRDVVPSGFENVVAPEAELWAPLQAVASFQLEVSSFQFLAATSSC